MQPLLSGLLFLVFMASSFLFKVRERHIQCYCEGHLLSGMVVWKLRHTQRFHIVYSVWHWHVLNFAGSDMQAMCRWHVLELHVSVVYQHLCIVCERLLLFDNRGSGVL